MLHGSFREKCSLLFRVFNIGNDEGVSREELRTMLTAIFQSTNTILYTVGHTHKAVLGGEDMQETITAMVTAAFANCDISRTGKLLPMVRDLAKYPGKSHSNHLFEGYNDVTGLNITF